MPITFNIKLIMKHNKIRNTFPGHNRTWTTFEDERSQGRNNRSRLFMRRKCYWKEETI